MLSTIVLITFNMSMGYYYPSKPVGFLDDMIKGADIICLQRVYVEDIEVILKSFPKYSWVFVSNNRASDVNADLEKSYSDFKSLPKERKQVGLLTLSRFPIVKAKNHILGHVDAPHFQQAAQGFNALETVIDIGKEKIVFLNVLPVFAEKSLTWKMWQDQVLQTLIIGKNLKSPVVIAGDFHTAPTAARWKEIDFAGWFDAWELAGEGPPGTWNPGEDQIDRVLVSKELRSKISKCTVVKNKFVEKTHNAIRCEITGQK